MLEIVIYSILGLPTSIFVGAPITPSIPILPWIQDTTETLSDDPRTEATKDSLGSDAFAFVPAIGRLIGPGEESSESLSGTFILMSPSVMLTSAALLHPERWGETKLLLGYRHGKYSHERSIKRVAFADNQTGIAIVVLDAPIPDAPIVRLPKESFDSFFPWDDEYEDFAFDASAMVLGYSTDSRIGRGGEVLSAQTGANVEREDGRARGEGYLYPGGVGGPILMRSEKGALAMVGTTVSIARGNRGFEFATVDAYKVQLERVIAKEDSDFAAESGMVPTLDEPWRLGYYREPGPPAISASMAVSDHRVLISCRNNYGKKGQKNHLTKEPYSPPYSKVLVFDLDPNHDKASAELVVRRDGEEEGFGAPCALSGSHAMIGAVLANDQRGAVYTFEQKGSGSWSERRRLQIPEGNAGDGFGTSIALHGDRAVISAPGDDDSRRNGGSLFIYECDIDGHWIETNRLVAPDAKLNAKLGQTVALQDGYILASARATHAGGPGVYVFEYNGRDWEQSALLRTAERAKRSDDFGSSIALHGNTALISAPGDETGGSVYEFSRRSNGNWAQTAKLRFPGDKVGNRFGESIALDGDLVVVSATQTNRTGSAYLFKRQDTGGWQPQALLRAGHDMSLAGSGLIVALTGKRAVLHDGKVFSRFDSGELGIRNSSTGFSTWAETALIFELPEFIR